MDPWTCTGSVTHFVWAGDNLLWELKQASGAAGGYASYFHAGGIDRPLVITKDGQSIIPHQNWRGQFARGTYPNGTKSDCPYFPAPSTCTPIQWPGERTSARHELEPDGRIQNWFGGLVDGMRDASGQMYMRNRYYDPKTGQFTQTDPIGLAGGLNAYGFAAGDPVSYADPYGLEPQCDAKAEASQGRLCPIVVTARPTLQQIVDGLENDEVMQRMLGTIGPGGGRAKIAAGGSRVLSRIGQHTGLTRLASRLSGSAQESVDNLVQQLSQGNFNPGIGTKHLVGDVFYARARDGARVFFRRVGDDAVEIVGKATKATESQVIRILEGLYR